MPKTDHWCSQAYIPEPDHNCSWLVPPWSLEVLLVCWNTEMVFKNGIKRATLIFFTHKMEAIEGPIQTLKTII